jgi:hypothetical protein
MLRRDKEENKLLLLYMMQRGFAGKQATQVQSGTNVASQTKRQQPGTAQPYIGIACIIDAFF